MRSDPEPRRALGSRKQRRCRCAPEVRPRERRCNTISALRRQMAVPTIAMLWRYLFSLARWRELARNDGADHGCACPATIRNVHPTEAMNATSSPKETETNEAVSSDGRQEPARSTAFAEGLTATAALYQTFGQSLGCRREADRSEAHTAVDLMAAPAMCSDFTRMPRQRTDRQPSRLKV